MHSWRRANADWEIRFYDDEACTAFVAAEFPEYLDAYRGLAKRVERSDFFRCVPVRCTCRDSLLVPSVLRAWTCSRPVFWHVCLFGFRV